MFKLVGKNIETLLKTFDFKYKYTKTHIGNIIYYLYADLNFIIINSLHFSLMRIALLSLDMKTF